MPTPTPQKRAAELRERIEKANYEYHVLDQPTISANCMSSIAVTGGAEDISTGR